MPSQFSSALLALQKANTSNFNRAFSISPPPSPNFKLRRRTPSQFELAKLALEASSPKEFNERFGFSVKERKSRRNRRATRKTRRSRRKN